MGINCAPLVADLFLFCYERKFMLSLSDNNQTDVVEAFNSTSIYLDDLLKIDNSYFAQMVRQIYPTDLLCFSVLCLLCLCARLFICALWSPAGKGPTFWLSFVV